MPQVTIEISDQHAKVLSKWASVSRTLKQAANLLEDPANAQTPLDRVDCIMELLDLEHPLDSLHQAVRSQLWQKDK